MRQSAKKYSQTERGKEQNRKDATTYRNRNPLKFRTRLALANSVRKGRIQRPATCSGCGLSCKPEAHHHLGYSVEHRFDVVWLCKSCHTEVHHA